MGKLLVVTIETAWVGASETVEVEIDGTETRKELEEIARDEFQNYCSYGWSISE